MRHTKTCHRVTATRSLATALWLIKNLSWLMISGSRPIALPVFVKGWPVICSVNAFSLNSDAEVFWSKDMSVELRRATWSALVSPLLLSSSESNFFSSVVSISVISGVCLSILRPSLVRENPPPSRISWTSVFLWRDSKVRSSVIHGSPSRLPSASLDAGVVGAGFGRLGLLAVFVYHRDFLLQRCLVGDLTSRSLDQRSFLWRVPVLLVDTGEPPSFPLWLFDRRTFGSVFAASTVVRLADRGRRAVPR